MVKFTSTILPVTEMENVLTRLRPGMCVRWLDRHVWVVLSASVLLGLGCERSSSSTDADAERNPYYQKARKLSELRDYKTAAVFYQKALLANPELADAHFELGLLYDDKLGDPIAAIFHYRSFLEQRPNSDKRQLVEDFIERSKLSLATRLPQSPAAEPAELLRLQNENTALLQENVTLKARVAELEKATQIATSVSAPITPARSSMAVVASESGSENPKAKTHVVQKGDTLQALALRYYGARSAWEKIYQANQTVLPSKNQLKIGQELVIP
jgi:tetratricopeptide (TPR) repeat protein